MVSTRREKMRETERERERERENDILKTWETGGRFDNLKELSVAALVLKTSRTALLSNRGDQGPSVHKCISRPLQPKTLLPSFVEAELCQAHHLDFELCLDQGCQQACWARPWPRCPQTEKGHCLSYVNIVRNLQNTILSLSNYPNTMSCYCKHL